MLTRCIVCTALLSLGLASQAQVRTVTVADIIEATDVPFARTQPVVISPDGKRYIIVLQRGDLARNGSWMRLVVGGTTSLAASSAKTAVDLFTRSKAEVQDLVKDLHWLPDSQNVVFLWNDGIAGRQIVKLNVQTREVKRLTNSRTEILSFDISADGNTIIYSAQEPHDSSKSAQMLREGFAVTDQHLWSLLDRNVDGWRPQIYRDEVFVVSPGRSAPRKVLSGARWRAFGPSPRISPDGRFAIVDEMPRETPQDWDRYRANDWFRINLPGAREPASANDFSIIRQLVLIDLRRGEARPLWDAPMAGLQTTVWSPDSKRILVGPAFLPSDTMNPDGTKGIAVAEVDVATGRYIELPVPPYQGPAAALGPTRRPLRWNSEDVVELGDPFAGSDQVKSRLQKQKIGGQWKVITGDAKPVQTKAAVRMELRQDLNSPPSLTAVDTATKDERVVLSTNPQFGRSIRLGHVELTHWSDARGEAWTGVLYYPVNYVAGKRFPLVIQTHGRTLEFSLSGAFTTAFAAQPLAGRDIVVLQMGAPDRGLTQMTPEEPRKYVLGWESAVKHLAEKGLVDPDKVGIIGFSRSGWHVEYALTHSTFPFVAAVVADNIDCSYLQYLIEFESSRSETEADNGGAPYGEGLQTWLQNAPGFNSDKIHTPLRLERDQGGLSALTSFWEMFSHLRHQKKPVELFVIPDVEHGVHVLQNPAQRMASQGGTLDWMDFWLNGREDPDPKKSVQYERWRKLRELQKRTDVPVK